MSWLGQMQGLRGGAAAGVHTAACVRLSAFQGAGLLTVVSIYWAEDIRGWILVSKSFVFLQ